MALPKFEKDISIISKLSDQPNDTAGSALSAADLKAKFDEGGNELKKFINETLIPYLEGIEAAASLGIKAISGMSEAGNVQEALEALKFAIDNTATGSIPDSSLGGEKLEPDSITDRELAPGAVQFSNMAPNAVSGDVVSDKGIGGSKLEDGCLENRHFGKLIVEDENIADKTIDAAGKIKNGTLTATLFAPGSVQTPAIGDGAVTDAKIIKGAVSTTYSLTIAASEWAGTEQSFTVSGLLAEDTPIIDLGTDGLTADELLAAAEEWAKILRIAVTAADTLTVTVSEVPTADITLRMLCIRR